MEQKKVLTVPNLITLIHLLLLPVLYIFLKNEMWIHAGFVFLLTGILDLLDGFLARLLNQFSELGKFLDPMVDKIGNVIVLILLLNQTRSIAYKNIFGLFLLIEIILMAGTTYVVLSGKTKKFQVTKLGKISMCFFFSMLCGFIFNLKFQNQTIYTILFFLAISIIFIRIYCLGKYILNFFEKQSSPE